METFAFIDASNLFYGGRKSLGWSIDFDKLYEYLRDRYGVSRTYYFGGVETHGFPFAYLTDDTVCLEDLEKHLTEIMRERKSNLANVERDLLNRHLKQVRFYRKLEEFGYKLILKPVKTYTDATGGHKRKANCDADMVFYMMRDRDLFDCAIVLSGDGDFLSVLKFLRDKDGKEVFVLAHTSRTAREIKRFAAEKFLDFGYLRERLKLVDKVTP